MSASCKIEVLGILSDQIDSLSGKECKEVLVVSFADGTATEIGLSIKSLLQIIRLKLGQKAKPAVHTPRPDPGPAQAMPAAVPVANGPVK